MAVIDTIYNAGDDALGYEFEITFGTAPSSIPLTNMAIRVQTVNIPELAIGEYEYDYKSDKVVKPNGKITTAKEFDFDIRLDKNYTLYDNLRTWSELIVSPSTGGYSLDKIDATTVPANRMSTITVKSGYLNLSGTFVATGVQWDFTNCWPKRVGAVSLDNQSGDPITITVTMGFNSLKKPDVAVATPAV